jgi:hypothetical protein
MTDLARIRIVANMISLEASSPSQSMEGILDRLPGFFDDVKTFVANLFDVSKEPAAGLLDTNRLSRNIKNVNYTTLMPVTVYTPMGLSVPYLDFLDVLEKAQNIVDLIPKETLQPFARWIAIQLSNPERLAGLQSERQVDGFKIHDIASVKAELAKCLSGDVRTEVPFSDVFRKSGDWDNAAHKANALNERVSAVGTKALLETVATITESLDTLLKRIHEDPVTYRTSGNAMKVIATLCTAMADECEFYSVYRYQLLATLTALNDTEEVLKKFK